MLTVLRQRNFALLWVGGLISATGDWVLFIALPIYIYRLTGSTLATSGMLVAELTPTLLLGSVAGVFVDRWNRKRIMVISNLILAVVLLPLLAVRSADLVWVAYIVGFTQSTVGLFFTPAETALLPTVVGEEHLVEANSLTSLGSNVSRLVGPPLGGAIAAVAGIGGTALADSASFLIAAVLVSLAAVPGRVVGADAIDTAEEAVQSWKAVWREWLAGLALVRHERFIAVVFSSSGLAMLGEGVFGVMFVVWVKQVLGGGALQLGWLMSGQAIGGLLGGLVIGFVGRRLSPRQLAGLGFVAFGLLDMALFSYPIFFTGFWIGIVLIILVGVPATAGGTGMTTLLQSGVRDEFRGRIFATLGTTQALLMLVGALIAGTLGSLVGPIALLNIAQGGTHILSGLVILTMLGRATLIEPVKGERSIATGS